MENRLEALRNEIDKLLDRSDRRSTRLYISHMYGVAHFCTLLALKRALDAELATTCGMLHDIGYMTGGGSENHAAKGAEQARGILMGMALYTEQEIALITAAIARHSDKQHIHEPYDELLKDADVLDHGLYNPAFPIAEKEAARYAHLLAELGIQAPKGA